MPKPFEVAITDNSVAVAVETISDGYEFIITNNYYEFIISEPAHTIASTGFVGLDFSIADDSMYLALFGGVM